MRRFAFALIVFLLPVTANAEGTQPFKFFGMLELSGAYHLSSVAADGIANAAYEKKFASGFEGTVHLGGVLGPLYLGLAYEYWSASRQFTLAGASQTDVLNYHSLGGEAGFLIHSNPRVYWLATVTAYYPLKTEINSSTAAGTVVYAAGRTIAYQGRIAIGFKLALRISGLFEGGYRLSNLGAFTSNGTALPNSGGDFDLTGPFAGVGLALHF